jgi:ATP-dependent DNA helicase PIF1
LICYYSIHFMVCVVSRAHQTTIKHTHTCMRKKTMSSTVSSSHIPHHISPNSLNEEQKYVFEKIKNGYSMMISSLTPGCGKTFLLLYCMRYLANRPGVYFTGSTGSVAQQLAPGIMTIHRLSGLGRGDQAPGYHLIKIRKTFIPWVKSFWQNCQVLFIDEISLLSERFFTLLDFVARQMPGKKFNEPFGGIQLVVFGDFKQLSPVPDRSLKEERAYYAFESEVWDMTFDFHIMLTQNMRQINDKPFNDLILDLSNCKLSEEQEKILERRKAPLPIQANESPPLYVYCTNREVELHNQRELNKLTHPAVAEYSAVDKLNPFFPYFKKYDLEDQCPLKNHVILKIGAQVRYLVNNISINKCLFNGSRGKVVSFEDATKYPVVRFETGETLVIEPYLFKIEYEDKTVASRCQFPLELNFASTIHSAQGKTLEKIVITIDNSFVHSLFFVALSRVRKLTDAQIVGNFMDLKPLPDLVIQFQKRFKKLTKILSEQRFQKNIEQQLLKDFGNGSVNSSSSMNIKNINETPNTNKRNRQDTDDKSMSCHKLVKTEITTEKKKIDLPLFDLELSATDQAFISKLSKRK